MGEKLRLIIFDLDGTLVDAYRAVSQSLNYSLGEMGVASIDDDTIKKSVGWGDRNLISRFVSPDKIDGTLSIYRQHHKRALKSGTKFLPGAKKTLKELKNRGFLLAIASNRPKQYTRIILKHLQVADCFDYVLCGDEVENAKPAADILNKILVKLDIVKEEALYVGDMAIDLEAGRAADIRTVAVATGSCDPQELHQENPFRYVERIEDLLGIVGPVLAGFPDDSAD